MTFSGHKHLCGCCWYYGRVSIARARSILNYLQFVRFMLFIPICHWMFGCEIINLRTHDDLRGLPGAGMSTGAAVLGALPPEGSPEATRVLIPYFTITNVVNHRITDARMYCVRINKRACPYTALAALPVSSCTGHTGWGVLCHPPCWNRATTALFTTHENECFSVWHLVYASGHGQQFAELSNSEIL